MIDSNKSEDIDSWSAGTCLGYLKGSDDMHYDMAYLISGRSKDNKIVEKYMLYCKPGEVSYGQEARIVIKYLKDNPEVLHYSASNELIIIRMKYFPCKDKNDLK